MGNLKKESGITLIALVVTIIVLLILAGVSVSMITGENGILKNAGEASEKTKIATEEEQRGMARYEAAMNLENMGYEDAEGNTATIPAGFAPTRIEGESLISEGLVITDVDGNEFVWIPCTIDEYNNANVEKWYGVNDYSTWSWNDLDSNEKEITNTAEQSILNYNGFYIARYEAGIPNNATFYISSNSKDKTYVKDEKKNKKEIISNLTPVSQKNKQAWNFINCYNAKSLSEKMYNSNSIKSYLVDSKAWMHICKNIFDKKTEKNINSSKTWGNYIDNTKTKYENVNNLWAIHTLTSDWNFASIYNTGLFNKSELNVNEKVELSTGSSEDFKAYNIYDMAGNMWEWTSKTVTNGVDTTWGAIAGGGFSDNGADMPVISFVGDSVCEYTRVFIGFRVVLYLK